MTQRPFDFSGATAVVLGGATGLGRAMATGLAVHGATVCVVSRSEEKAEAAADAIRQRSDGRCWAHAADVSTEASIQRLRETLDRRFGGRLNIAINSAGINVRHPIEEISLEEWESIQRVNSTGAFLFAREMFPLLKARRMGPANSHHEHFRVPLVRRPHELRFEQGCASPVDAHPCHRVGRQERHRQRDLARPVLDRDDPTIAR
jgi:NAD(P)-dependent dehydrogenase (short-subunit alcohol dehydrogenase family)